MTGLDLQLNDLVRDPAKGTVRAKGTGRIETLACDMVLGSIGYCSVALPGVPFDSSRGIIPNRYVSGRSDGGLINPGKLGS